MRQRVNLLRGKTLASRAGTHEHQFRRQYDRLAVDSVDTCGHPGGDPHKCGLTGQGRAAVTRTRLGGGAGRADQPPGPDKGVNAIALSVFVCMFVRDVQ
jgi:hypothetical protein